MRQVDLTLHPLFDNFCEFNLDGVDIDLHNDFNCVSVKFSGQQLSIDFDIDENILGPVQKIAMIFKDVLISSFEFELSSEDSGIWTIDYMYRERIENADGELVENQHGRYFYHIGFYEQYSIELFAGNVSATVTYP